MPQVAGAIQFALTVAVTAVAPGLGAAAINAVVAGIGYAATSYAITAASNALFRPDAPQLPKPEDGKFNLKQVVPPLTYVLGRVLKGGDYALLEERNGIAYHITSIASHSINGFVRHRLHDEDVTLDGTGVVNSPSHFGTNVQILTRLGADAETAYQEVIDVFPEIWTVDHRGDGLASVMMSARSVSAQSYRTVYPQQMPEQKHLIEGNDRIYDPRTGAHGYTTNVALFRLWHLTHPVGGKLSLDDMYLPDWINAANVCDQAVTNRDGETESRYHGGIWFRANNDPVEIGRNIDQAGDLVLYERADGKVGVHAGEFVEPTLRLTEQDIISLSFDANRRQATNVLAVRGRYTNVEENFTTADAAIFGDPYIGENTERTATVENTVVQSHNHIQRLQKLKKTRTNAPRVSVTADYFAAKGARRSRFVRVHVPPRLDEAVLEIVGGPVVSLRNLTITFEGIIVPDTLYEFDASTEEGEPPATIVEIEDAGVPEPVNFGVVIRTEVISGGGTAAFAEASWDSVSDALQYEFEWVPSGGGTRQSVASNSGETEVRSGYLVDGETYNFRLRTISAGSVSDWTEFETRTATADPAPPASVTTVSGVGGAGSFTFSWTAPNSQNYFAARLYLATVDDFASATLVGTDYGAPNDVESREITALASDDYYGWIEAINASGVAAAEVATGVQTVS